jgi:MtN3 and saliva related transmembrane protein
MNAGWMAGIGYVAGLCTTFSLVPQVLRIVRLRSARDVSIEMYLLFSLGTLLWLGYALALHSWPMIVWNVISFLLGATIVMLKLRFDRNAGHEIVHPLSKE